LFAGKKTDIIIRNLKQVFDEAVYHQPSLIILDDIESIAGVEAEREQHLLQDCTFKRYRKHREQGTQKLLVFQNLGKKETVM